MDWEGNHEELTVRQAASEAHKVRCISSDNSQSTTSYSDVRQLVLQMEFEGN